MSKLMYGSRFILSCCNVIFDTYCRCSFRHIFRSASYANELSQTVPLPAKNESEAKPNNNMAAMEEQNSKPHERAFDLRDKENGARFFSSTGFGRLLMLSVPLKTLVNFKV